MVESATEELIEEIDVDPAELPFEVGGYVGDVGRHCDLDSRIKLLGPRAMLGLALGPADESILGRVVEVRAASNVAQSAWVEGKIQSRLMTVVGVLSEDFEFPAGQRSFYAPMIALRTE